MNFTKQTDWQNKRYQKKYKLLKTRIKSLILENAALCDEVARIQESILIVKDERKFLLRKLLEYQMESELTQVHYKNHKNETNITMNGSKAKFKKRHSLEEAGKI